MSSFLPSECLENIFLNFTKDHSGYDRPERFTKDLYSCTLVSRHWCRISTPFLYAYPFNHFKNQWNPNNSYYRLIRTLLSCVPQSEIRRIYITYAQTLSANHIPFNKIDSYSNISSIFNYISFMRGFIFDELILESQNVCNHKSIWLSAHNPESISSEKTIRIMNHLIKFIFKHCRNLTMLGLSLYIKYSYVINFSQFISLISLQNKLQHIQHIELLKSNFRWDTTNLSDYSNLFNLLSTKCGSLRTLEFNGLSFNGIDKNVLNLLCSLKNIRELKLHYCFDVDNVNSWAKSLTKLKVLEFTFYYNIPEDFLNHLLQSSSNTLTKLVINITNFRSQNFTQIFQQTPLYLLHSLNHLELPEVLSTKLISIFKSCSKLVYLSVIFIDVVFKDLGEFIPKTLERIRFKLSINETSFKEYLKCFLEGYINSNGNGALKHLEFGHSYDQVDSFVTYGIQVTVSKGCILKDNYI